MWTDYEFKGGFELMVIDLLNIYKDDTLNNCDVLIIPDLHDWFKNINSIKSMIEDLAKYKQEILEYCKTLKNPVVIFAGDIFHREVKMTDDAYNLQQFYGELNSICKKRVFSVVGNHELSYQANNLFWNIAMVVSDIFPPKDSRTPLLYVTDELLIGSSLFHFGHYSRIGYTSEIKDKTVEDEFLITHNALLTSEISQALKEDSEEFSDKYLHGLGLFDTGAIPASDKLRAIFVGHMHLAHNTYQIKETVGNINYDFILQYMASIGRTNAAEFTDDLIRELPTVHIRDGKFQNITNYKLELVAREFAVNEMVVQKNKESYKRQQRNNEIRHAEISFPNGLLPAITDFIRATNPMLESTMIYAQSGTVPLEVSNVLSKYGI